MIAKSEVPDEPVVLEDVGAEFLNLGFVLEVRVTLEESFVQVDDLAQGEVLPWGLVQPSRSLYKLIHIITIRTTTTQKRRDTPSTYRNPAHGL